MKKLTGEMLLNKGFTKKDNEYHIELEKGEAYLSITEDTFMIAIYADEQNYIDGDYPTFATDICLREEQLDNIYFALTGKELLNKIK